MNKRYITEAYNFLIYYPNVICFLFKLVSLKPLYGLLPDLVETKTHKTKIKE